MDLVLQGPVKCVITWRIWGPSRTLDLGLKAFKDCAVALFMCMTWKNQEACYKRGHGRSIGNNLHYYFMCLSAS